LWGLSDTCPKAKGSGLSQAIGDRQFVGVRIATRRQLGQQEIQVWRVACPDASSGRTCWALLAGSPQITGAVSQFKEGIPSDRTRSPSLSMSNCCRYAGKHVTRSPLGSTDSVDSCWKVMFQIPISAGRFMPRNSKERAHYAAAPAKKSKVLGANVYRQRHLNRGPDGIEPSCPRRGKQLGNGGPSSGSLWSQTLPGGTARDLGWHATILNGAAG
jgi:hypothetical protein